MQMKKDQTRDIVRNALKKAGADVRASEFRKTVIDPVSTRSSSLHDLDAAQPQEMPKTLKKWSPIGGDGSPSRYIVAAEFFALEYNGYVISLEQITPARARAYQNSIPDEKRVNRNFRPANLKRIQAALRDIRWIFSGGTIIFNEDGHLIDGKHRLKSIIEENKTILVVVVRGIKRKAFSCIDTGTIKTFADALYVNGNKACNTLGSALKVIDEYKRYGRVYEASTVYSPDMASELERKYSGVKDLMPTGQMCEGVASASLCIALHYLFAEKDDEAARKFMTRLGTGINIMSKNEAMFKLRSKLEQMRKENLSQKSGINREIAAALIVKTWSAERIDQQVKVLRYDRSNESFPKIV